MRQCLWPRGEVCMRAAVLFWLLLMSGEDVFRSRSLLPMLLSLWASLWALHRMNSDKLSWS